MKTVKKYINKQIMTIVGDLIEKREEMDIVINFDTYEDDFYVDYLEIIKNCRSLLSMIH